MDRGGRKGRNTRTRRTKGEARSLSIHVSHPNQKKRKRLHTVFDVVFVVLPLSSCTSLEKQRTSRGGREAQDGSAVTRGCSALRGRCTLEVQWAHLLHPLAPTQSTLVRWHGNQPRRACRPSDERITHVEIPREMVHDVKNADHKW